MASRNPLGSSQNPATSDYQISNQLSQKQPGSMRLGSLLVTQDTFQAPMINMPHSHSSKHMSTTSGGQLQGKQLNAAFGMARNAIKRQSINGSSPTTVNQSHKPKKNSYIGYMHLQSITQQNQGSDAQTVQFQPQLERSVESSGGIAVVGLNPASQGKAKKIQQVRMNQIKKKNKEGALTQRDPPKPTMFINLENPVYLQTGRNAAPTTMTSDSRYMQESLHTPTIINQSSTDSTTSRSYLGFHRKLSRVQTRPSLQLNAQLNYSLAIGNSPDGFSRTTNYQKMPLATEGTSNVQDIIKKLKSNERSRQAPVAINHSDNLRARNVSAKASTTYRDGQKMTNSSSQGRLDINEHIRSAINTLESRKKQKCIKKRNNLEDSKYGQISLNYSPEAQQLALPRSSRMALSQTPSQVTSIGQLRMNPIQKNIQNFIQIPRSRSRIEGSREVTIAGGLLSGQTQTSIEEAKETTINSSRFLHKRDSFDNIDKHSSLIKRSIPQVPQNLLTALNTLQVVSYFPLGKTIKGTIGFESHLKQTSDEVGNSQLAIEQALLNCEDASLKRFTTKAQFSFIQQIITRHTQLSESQLIVVTLSLFERQIIPSLSLAQVKSLVLQVIDKVSTLCEQTLSTFQTTTSIISPRQTMLDMLASDLSHSHSVITNLQSSSDLSQLCQYLDYLTKTPPPTLNREECEKPLETWQLLSQYLEVIDAHLPAKQPELPEKVLNFMILETGTLRNDLIRPITQQMLKVEKQIIGSLEVDTSSLKRDLTKAIDILQASAQTTKSQNGAGVSVPMISLNVYIEQLNTLKVLTSTSMRDQLFLERHNQIKRLSSILKQMSTQSQTTKEILLNMSDIDKCLNVLPDIISECTKRISQQRPTVEHQLYQGCMSLSQKLTIFENKYIERYLENWKAKVQHIESQQCGQQEAISTLETLLGEIRIREKMIEEIRQKCDLYKECIDIVQLREDTFKDHVTCFSTMASLQQVHSSVLKLWSAIHSFKREIEPQMVNKPFLQFKVGSTITDLEGLKTSIIEEEKVQSCIPEVTRQKLVLFRGYISKRLSECIFSLVQVEKLQTRQITDPNLFLLSHKHWKLLFCSSKSGGKQFKEDFSLQDLVNNKIDTRTASEVLDMAIEEDRARLQLARVRRLMDGHELRLKITSLSAPEDQSIDYRISDSDCSLQILEQLHTELEKQLKSNAHHDLQILEEVKHQIEQLKDIKELLGQVVDVQKQVQSGQAFFSYKPLRVVLVDHYKDLVASNARFQDQIMSKLSEQPHLNTMMANSDTWKGCLDVMASSLDLIQKAIENYFEERRLGFPRLFFMTDIQCLEFLMLAEKSQDFNHLFHVIFPGADKVLTDQPFVDSVDKIEAPQPLKIREPTTNSSVGPLNVLGMISKHKELLLFTKQVPYTSSDVPLMLQTVELEMQQTIGNLIGEAVASFPKQSLDEWILDYPLQTILTTIHLILTHEINELFDEMVHNHHHPHQQQHHRDHDDFPFDEEDEIFEKGQRAEHRQDYGQLNKDQLPEILGLVASNQRAPDTRDLVVATASSHGVFQRRRQGHQRTISVQNLNEEYLKSRAKTNNHQRVKSCQQIFKKLRGKQVVESLAGNDITPFEEGYYRNQEELNQEEQNEMEGEDEDEWMLFKHDMFGSDFDLSDEANVKRKVQIGFGEDRDEIMRILQEKSFKGLYLRLQFWINQICKSLRQAASRNSEVHLSYQPQQRAMMETIINFLSFMKDVVFELKVKSVSNIEDFEWQKQIRLTWQGTQNEESKGCRVDCGAWQTYQSNEYMGNFIHRLPLTPLTNKYFIFISAALREKSAVLFKCMPTHDYSSDVFQEFASICTTPLKHFHCSSIYVTMKSLMQYLNGAALASTWIFFEHVDKLDYLHLQTFNKEIQMVQQQFIIAELSQGSEEDNNEQQERRHEDDVVPEGLSENDSLRIHSSNVNSQYRNKQSHPVHSKETRDRYGSRTSNAGVLRMGDQILIASERKKPRGNDRHMNDSENRSPSMQHDYYQELQPQTEHSQERKSYHSSQSNRGSQGSKVCFGVFASMSHRFSLQHEQWAAEVSSSLQSAFRVLSLTKPELPLITTMLLKSQSFKHYENLSSKLHEFFFRVKEDVLGDSITDRDDWFSLTVRDIKRLAEACGSMLHQKGNDILEMMSLDDQRRIENEVVRKVGEFFVIEKVYSYVTSNQIEYEALRQGTCEIADLVFGITKHQAEHALPNIPNLDSTLEKEGLICDSRLHLKIAQAIEMVSQQRPVIIVGDARSGKQSVLNVIQSILMLEPVYLNPEVIGTFREVYGMYDPLCGSQVATSEQLGDVTHSLLSVVLSVVLSEPPKKLLVISTKDMTNPLFDSLIPYFENQQTYQNRTKVDISLPNGLVTQIPQSLAVVVKSRSLSKASPRLISSMLIVSLEKPFADSALLTKALRHRLLKIGIKVEPVEIQAIVNPILRFNQKAPVSVPSIDWIETVVRQLSALKATSNFNRLLFLASYQTFAFTLSEVERRVFDKVSDITDLKKKYNFDPDLSLLEVYYDTTTASFKKWDSDISFPLIDNIFITKHFQICKHYYESMMKNSDFSIVGDVGSGKKTLMKYLVRDSKIKSVYLPAGTLLLSKRSLRHILMKSESCNRATVLIDDRSMLKHDALEYLLNVRANRNLVFDPSSPKPLPLPFKSFNIIETRSSNHRKGMTTFRLDDPFCSDPILVNRYLSLSVGVEVPKDGLQLSNAKRTLTLPSIQNYVETLRAMTTMITNNKPIIKELKVENILGNEIRFTLECPILDLRLLSTSRLGLVIIGRPGQDLNAQLEDSATDSKEYQLHHHLTIDRFRDYSKLVRELFAILRCCSSVKAHPSPLIVLNKDLLEDPLYLEIVDCFAKIISGNVDKKEALSFLMILQTNHNITQGVEDEIRLEEYIQILMKSNARFVLLMSEVEVSGQSRSSYLLKNLLCLDLRNSPVSPSRNMDHQKYILGFEDLSLLAKAKEIIVQLILEHNSRTLTKDQKVPQHYFENERRYQQFVQVFEDVKGTITKCLKQSLDSCSLQSLKYTEIASAVSEQNISTKGQQTAFSLMNVQERLDMITTKIKQLDSIVRQTERETVDLKSKYQAMMKDVLDSKQLEARLVPMLENLLSLGEQGFRLFKIASQRDQQLSTVSSLISSILSLKSIQDLSLSDLVQKMRHRSSLPLSEIQKRQLREIACFKFEKDSLQSQLAMILSELSQAGQRQQQQNVGPKQLIKNAQQVRDTISFNYGMIALHRRQMISLNEEAEDLIMKERNLLEEVKRANMTDASRQARNEQAIRSIVKEIGKTSEGRMEKIKVRSKNLVGDCLMIAASVVYIGFAEFGARVKLRAELSELLTLRLNLESSESWSNVTSESQHCKYFKKFIQGDLGLSIVPGNHTILESVICEYLTFQILSKSIAVTIDSSGLHSDYLLKGMLNKKYHHVHASDIASSEFLSEELMHNLHDRVLLLTDFHCLQDSNDGKSYPLMSLDSEQSLLACNSQRLPGVFGLRPDLKIPLVQIISTRSISQNIATHANIIDLSFINRTEAWIEVKQILLKHFLPESYQRLTLIMSQQQALKSKIKAKREEFESLTIKLTRDNIQQKQSGNINEGIRNSYIKLMAMKSDLKHYTHAFHQLINEHPLLASYSNIFVIMYWSLKELERITKEGMYSWKVYLKVIDAIVAKIIRDLSMNMKNRESEEERDQSGEPSLQDQDKSNKRQSVMREKEFTIDEDFFHQVIMPAVTSTIVAGIKQEHISLFNLIFAMEIAMKKGSITEEEKTFFFLNFLSIRNYQDWRLNIHRPSTIPSGFVQPNQSNEKVQLYSEKKKALLKLYPDARKLFESLEIKIGKDFTFGEASLLLYKKLFKQSTSEGKVGGQHINLMKQLNIGFLCPDNEWRSKVCQFMYEELSTIFDFTEDLSKLHSFIKTASWHLPIALLTQNSINIVNTVCSIASYYGVGLEVLRTDSSKTIKRRDDFYRDQELGRGLDTSALNDDVPLSQEAAVLHFQHVETERTPLENYRLVNAKDEMEIEEKQHQQQQQTGHQQQVDLISRCAKNGTWVLISTLKFPSYWSQVCSKLESMAAKGKILNTFRIFFDLQGYSMNEIPRSFLFDNSVKFYLTERNNEDMEGFNDVWANILNDDLLNAKDLNNVLMLEPISNQSYIPQRPSVNTNILESSMIENLVPKLRSDTSHSTSPAVISRHQSSQSIVLPTMLSSDAYLQEIIFSGGKDIESPKSKGIKNPFKFQTSHEGGGLSEISLSDNRDRRGNEFYSEPQSFLFGSSSYMKKGLQPRDQKIKSSLQRHNSEANREEQKQPNHKFNEGQRIEMVQAKHPSKRLQPAQKH